MLSRALCSRNVPMSLKALNRPGSAGKLPMQLMKYASAVAPISHEGTLVRISQVKKLSELQLHFNDSHLGESELAAKVLGKLRKLEAEVLARNQAFNEAHPLVFDPKRAFNDEIFLCCSLCCIIFLIFLFMCSSDFWESARQKTHTREQVLPFNQYEEFAHELSFDIREQFGLGFYMLLGLHGSHVIFGTIMLALLTLWGAQGSVGPQSHALRFTSLYVHLVDLVFIILVLAIYSANASPELYGGIVPNILEARTFVSVDAAGNPQIKEF